MGTPLAVDGDIEVEICNAAQDICNDGQEYGSAIVSLHKILLIFLLFDSINSHEDMT